MPLVTTERPQSFYAGPSFTARRVLGIDRLAYDIHCQGKLRGRVTAEPNCYLAWQPEGDQVKAHFLQIAGSFKSLRSAGIAVLKAAGVKGDL